MQLDSLAYYVGNIAKLIFCFRDLQVHDLLSWLPFFVIISLVVDVIVNVIATRNKLKEKNIAAHCISAIKSTCIEGVVVLILWVLYHTVPYAVDAIYSWNKECCSSYWITNNISGLSLALSQKVHGQHLVVGPIVKHLRGHIESPPSKPLVLSFHGTSGTGKNFVSTLIAEHLYKEGIRSQYVHFFSATRDFMHKDKTNEYKIRLKTEIESAGKACYQQLFIFDEFDKIPTGLIDVIKPYLDIQHHIDGVDYRRNIFIFLSNQGGDDITNAVMVHLDEKKGRYQLKLRDLEIVITQSKAFRNSGLTKSNLITAFVPFLPLERRHVEQCIVNGLFAKRYYSHDYQVNQATVRAIADELTYFPEKTKMFSTTGCKRVLEKIDLIVYD